MAHNPIQLHIFLFQIPKRLENKYVEGIRIYFLYILISHQKREKLFMNPIRFETLFSGSMMCKIYSKLF